MEMDDLAIAGGDPSRSRCGDIILVLNRELGRDTWQYKDAELGTHGGATEAESRVPMLIAYEGFKVGGGMNRWVEEVLGEVKAPRTLYFRPMVEKIFEVLGE